MNRSLALVYNSLKIFGKALKKQRQGKYADGVIIFGKGKTIHAGKASNLTQCGSYQTRPCSVLTVESVNEIQSKKFHYLVTALFCADAF